MMPRLNNNQIRLLKFLQSKPKQWTYCRDIANLVYGKEYNGNNFYGSAVQRVIAKDIKAINNSNSTNACIIYCRTKGIKLGNKEDVKLVMKEIEEAENRLILARKKLYKIERLQIN